MVKNTFQPQECHYLALLGVSDFSLSLLHDRVIQGYVLAARPLAVFEAM